MNKKEILKQYRNEEKLLVAKLLDKIEYSDKYNKIVNTNFVNELELKTIINVLNKVGVLNYAIYGGYSEAQRKIIVFYPQYFDERMLQKNYDAILKIVKITLPQELYNKYCHRDYLSALIKIGIKREKIGDILVSENGASILLLNEVVEYVVQNISQLTRFSKSQIEVIKLEDLKFSSRPREQLEIIVPSLRIDSIVAELAKTSRGKANELILQERVLINYEIIAKNSKLVKEKDIVTIRGKGKFQVMEQIGTTKKGNNIIKVEKYN